MRDTHDALKQAAAEVDQAAKLAEDDEQKEHLERALHLLLLVQAFEESDGQHRETVRGVLEHTEWMLEV
jgi:hypothetical protein